MQLGFEHAFGIADACRDIRFDGRTDHAIFMEAIALHGLADGDLDAAYRRAVDGYLAELGPSIAARSGTVLPGIPALLDALAESHGALGLATGNMRRGAAIKLGHFGLWERFPAGGFGDTTSIRAEVVREGIEALAAYLHLEADPADALVIGDTPLDVEAAHLAGARALAVATGAYEADTLWKSGAEWVLPDLSATDAVVELLRS